VCRYPLHAAAASGRDDAVLDLLLARGGCARHVANAVDGDGLTALHRAAAAGLLRINSRGCFAPLLECTSKQIDRMFDAGKALCVAALLDSGAAQQVQTALNPTAVTPMLLAAARGHDECVRLLAVHNPAGDAFGKDDCLQISVLILVSHSAAVHACDANGVTPLMMAAAHASLAAVDALLQAGARPSAVDIFGRRFCVQISSVK
jgi:hypothetical protein